ncbi:MAG: cytochrome c3 family protein [Gammaproteobacteria bacterium]|nr:cytochrome c3 family protein [Gammaproteobacteria bacterium]
MNGIRFLWLWIAVGLAPAMAAPVSDVRNTKHNLSVTGPGPVKAVSETQVCVFCHTPHGAENIPAAPLWNRQLSGATYTPYTSNSIDATDIAATPGGSSKLCLSCHDGTLAIGQVNVANGQLNPVIAMTGTELDGSIPAGEGELTGFTRRLGVNLTNDHPISFTYDTSLALADGELRDPQASPHILTREPGVRPVVPLENGQLECTSCHDPHIRDEDPTKSIKFLRLNRFQTVSPTGGPFNEATDIVCVACHDKLGTAWSRSAHADSTIADEQYKSGPNSPAELREFPDGIRVWEASCLNCHDTHTVQGARRLLREGTDAVGSPTVPRSGGGAAIESTCYQCHTTAAESILVANTQVPNIESDFNLPRHMPIESIDQPAGSEVHDVVDSDLTETRANLGFGDLNNRHAECTDCHNPHRVQRNRLFNGGGATVAGTHDHDAAEHSNIASGVLRGAWGVEPNYGSTSFQDLPVSYTVKQGDGGDGASTAVTSTWVTREYQICLKCHSDFGYLDNNVYPTGNRPNLGDSSGGTPSGTNGLTQYTNQAKEFQAPVTHQGVGTKPNSGAAAAYATNNHRSWHPVMGPTGRTLGLRNAAAALWESPFDRAVGTQTMYCSDCHGSATAQGTVVPTGGENGNPWGPHGSTNNFILKGVWDSETGTGGQNDLCFKCHDYTLYSTDNNDQVASGFFSSNRDNLHAFHFKRIGRVECTWCHVAVPHGFKNRSLLVNLNDVGPEAGLAPGTEVPIGSSGQAYTQEPYYLEAKLKIRTFASPGDWNENNCGSQSGNPSTGADWMKDVCENPP